MSRIDFLNPTNEERLLFAKICDLCERAEKGRMCFSRFLNLREQEIAKAALAPYNVTSIFYGGFKDSEKAMLGLSDSSTDLEESYFPISLLTLEFPKNAEFSHRDVLGSLMALGIERNSAGEIFLYENKASFPVISSIEDTVMREMTSVGKYSVKIVPYEGDGIIKKETEDKTAVISSMRLDCVIAAITNKSRSTVSSLIRKQPVLVNDKKCDKIDEIVPEGAVITIRGFGKFKLSYKVTKTSKERLRIVISKYI